MHFKHQLLNVSLVDDILKIQGVGVASILKDSSLTSLVLRTYAKLYNCKSPQFCSKAITDYKKAIDKINPEDMATKARKYILKEGKMIQYRFTKYTNENLTDSIAAKMIKEIPSLKECFEDSKAAK